jgi:hypothetical protein
VSLEDWYARIGERLAAGQKPGQIAAWLRDEHGVGAFGEMRTESAQIALEGTAETRPRG